MNGRFTVLSSLLIALASPLLAHCADAPAAPEKIDTAPSAVKTGKAGHAKTATGAAVGAEPSESAVTPSGKVAETMNAGGYAYVRLEKEGKSTWVAFPASGAKVGDALSFKGCVTMKDFESKTLKRTFELVYFCGNPNTKDEKEKGAEAKPIATADKKSPGSAGSVSVSSRKIKVEKASGANAYTIVQLFAQSTSLNGKPVVVKGEVTKVSPRIMGKNWIHLQDGSGSAKQKTNDLVITSAELPEVGAVVTISGTLAKDKDFGSGYKYNVIVEKGHIKK